MNIIFMFACLLASPSLCQQRKECDEGYDCVTAKDCQYYREEVKKLKTFKRDSSEFKSHQKALRNLVCHKKPNKICCKTSYNNSPSWVPLPEAGECGVSGPAPSFIVGGENTELGEFPWMALLGTMKTRETVEFSCGGALINKWSVLS